VSMLVVQDVLSTCGYWVIMPDVWCMFGETLFEAIPVCPT
jgi:hypothetical protein